LQRELVGRHFRGIHGFEALRLLVDGALQHHSFGFASLALVFRALALDLPLPLEFRLAALALQFRFLFAIAPRFVLALAPLASCCRFASSAASRACSSAAVSTTGGGSCSTTGGGFFSTGGGRTVLSATSVPLMTSGIGGALRSEKSNATNIDDAISTCSSTAMNVGTMLYLSRITRYSGIG
jgi:hypothetical protein